jgi:hypothetical protein
MASKAAMERDISGWASNMFLLSKHDDKGLELDIEPKAEPGVSSLRSRSDLMHELTKTLSEKAATP